MSIWLPKNKCKLLQYDLRARTTPLVKWLTNYPEDNIKYSGCFLVVKGFKSQESPCCVSKPWVL